MLTAPAVVDNTVRSVVKRSGPGSEVVFDYVFDDVVTGDFSKYPGARYEVVEAEVKGEPWIFGIAEGKSAEFLTQRGLDVISDLGAEELARRYLVKSDGSLDGIPTPYYRIIHAVVRK